MNKPSLKVGSRRLLLLLIGLVAVDIALHLGSSSAAAVDKPAPSPPQIHYPSFEVEAGRMRFFHVALVVEDLQRSIDFYTRELGFKLIRTQQSQLWKLALLTTGEREPILEVEEYIGPDRDPPPTGFSHVGMFVDDLDAFYERSRANGVPWSQAPTSYGSPVPDMGFLTDPDGYRIEVMQNPSGGCTGCHRGPHLP